MAIKRLRIGLDVDGVLADFSKAFTDLAFHLQVSDAPAVGAADQPTWDFNFPVDPVWRVVDSAINWWEKVPSLLSHDDVMDLNDLINDHKVYFLTNRKDSDRIPYNRPVEEQTRRWLREQGVIVDYATVLSCRNKAAVAKALELDIVLDDSPNNLEDFKQDGVNGVRFARPYNADTPDVPFVTSLEEFYLRLKELC